MPSDQRGDDRSTGGDMSWGASDGREAVSPELVLVAPPDEARRAREQLPESPEAEWDHLLSRARARSVHRPSEPPPPTPAPRRRRWVRKSVLVVALLILVASAVTVGLAATRDNGGEGAAQHNVTPVRHQSSTAPSTTHVTTAAKKPKKSAQSPSGPAPQRKARPKAHAAPKKAPAKKPTRQRRPARPAVTGFVPARTWSWEPQSRTRRYVFTLQRNGKRVIAARTTKPRFVLPGRFRFAAGRYRWRVVAVGARRKVVVDSKFRLSAAGAAAANQ